MPEGLALGRVHVGERGSRGLKPDRHVGDAERRQRRHVEVSAEIAHGAAKREGGRVPERQRRAGRLQSRQEITGRARGLRHQDLARPPHERRRQDGVLAARVFPCPEVAGGDVEQRDAGTLARTDDGEEEVVGGAGQERGVGDRPRRDEPHDVALEELLALAGRFELLAQRDLLAGPDQPCDVRLGGVMRNPRHRRALAGGQRDLQQAGAQLGVLEEQLVEVTEPEQEQVVRVPLLQLPVLAHHRRHDRRGLSHEGAL